MQLSVVKVPLQELGSLRADFLRELNAQFTYDKCHLYGWADTYLFSAEGIAAGYGGVWGKDKREDRDSIMEFYLKPEYRGDANEFFSEFISVSGAVWIESQSNDKSLSPMLFEYADGIWAEAILFEEDFQSSLKAEGVEVVAGEANGYDRPFVLKVKGEVVANGGLLLNYNFPYADIYYGVEEAHRRKGYGAFFVQELKKAAYAMGHVPAARTRIDNLISKRTMMKAGLKVCGWRLGGKIGRKGKI